MWEIQITNSLSCTGGKLTWPKTLVGVVEMVFMGLSAPLPYLSVLSRYHTIYIVDFGNDLLGSDQCSHLCDLLGKESSLLS